MANLKQILAKQGGSALLKQYWHSGALGTAVCQFLLLGKSRTALEILRLSAQFKGRRKLFKRYKKALAEFDATYTQQIQKSSDRVWVCWLQGMESAPPLVQKCFQSLNTHLTGKQITLITAENMDEYVHFPPYILEKWKKGIITHTHLTDLLRLELLINHGGMWLDATVLCTRPIEQIPSYYFDAPLFMYQLLKPGRDGHSHLSSSWLISAQTNSKLLQAVRYLCYRYWEKENKMLDYFLLHDFMAICLEHYKDIWNSIVPCSNETPHILLLRLFEPFDQQIYEATLAQTPFHKLSYKFQPEQTALPDTYYQHIMQQHAGGSYGTTTT